MANGNDDQPEQHKYSKELLLQDHIDAHETTRTKEGSVNLLELAVGDHIKISFYPNEEYMVDHPSLYLAIAEKPDPNRLISVVGSGGPDAWNDQVILINGSALSPNVSAIKPDVIEAGLYIRYKIFDPDLVEAQENNLVPMYTPWGNMLAKGYAEILRKFIDQFPTEADVQKALKGGFGWREGHTPKVADIKVDRNNFNSHPQD